MDPVSLAALIGLVSTIIGGGLKIISQGKETRNNIGKPNSGHKTLAAMLEHLIENQTKFEDKFHDFKTKAESLAFRVESNHMESKNMLYQLHQRIQELEQSE